MADYSVNIQLGVGGQRYLDAVINQAGRLEKLVESINKTPIALNIGGRGALRDASGILSKEINTIAREFVNGDRKIGESVSSISQQVAVFQEFLGQTFIKGTGAIDKQSSEVKNLANTWADASTKLDLYERKLENLLRTAKGLPTLEQEAATQARAAGRLVTPKGTISPPSAGPISRRAPSGAGGGTSSFLQDIALGAGFPLLFGGGAGAVLGGALGSFGGFGGQIAGSAIGQILDQAIQKAGELGSAVQQLSLDALEESGYRVNSALRTQIDLLKQVGDAKGAQIALEQDILATTGALPGTVGGIADAVNLLNSAWNETTNAASTLLGIVGAPFAAALAAILKFVNLIIKGINVAFSAVGAILKTAGEFVVKLVAGDEAVKRINDGLKANNQELERARAIYAEILSANNAEILLNRQVINLEKQRTDGRTEAQKLQNAQLDYQIKQAEINAKYDNSRLDINKTLTETNGDLVKQQLTQNETLRKQALELAEIKADRAASVIIATEQEKRDRDAAQELEKQRKELERIAKLRITQLSDAQDNYRLAETERDLAGAMTDESKLMAAYELEKVKRMIDFRKLYEKSLSDQEREFIIETQYLKAIKSEIEYEDKLAEIQKTRTRELYAQLGAVDILGKKTQEQLADVFGGYTDIPFDLKLDVVPGITDGKLGAELEKVRRQLENLLEPARQVSFGAEAIGKSFSESFVDTINGSVSAQQALANFFQGVANAFLDMAAQMIAKYIQMQIIGLATSLLPSGGLFKGAGPYQFGGGGNVTGTAFSPGLNLMGRANGGSVSSGTPYLVGERGPELFVPGASGNIVPNHSMGASNIVVNVDATGTQVQGDQPNANKLGEALGAAVRAELLRQKRPGGLLA